MKKEQELLILKLLLIGFYDLDEASKIRDEGFRRIAELEAKK